MKLLAVSLIHKTFRLPYLQDLKIAIFDLHHAVGTYRFLELSRWK